MIYNKISKAILLLLSLSIFSCNETKTQSKINNISGMNKQELEKKEELLCPKTTVKTFEVNDFNVEGFECKDVKAFYSTVSSYETSQKRVAKTIEVYLANYTIEISNTLLVSKPNNEGEYLIKLVYQGEFLPYSDKLDENQLEVKAGEFIPDALKASEGQTVNVTVYQGGHRKMFDPSRIVVKNIPIGNAKLIKLNDKEVCGSFQLKMGVQFNLEASFTTSVLK